MNGQRMHLLTFYRTTDAASDWEADEEATEEVAAVLASLEPQSGSETVSGEQIQGRTQYKIRARWGPSLSGIDSTWWAMKGIRRFNFLSVQNIEERNREVVIVAVENG